MIKIPQQTWSQPNNSDKFGSLAYTKNITLDEEGYIKLSPRTIKVMDDDIDTNFGLPVAIGKSGNGEWEVATTSNANFTGDTHYYQNAWTENDGTSNPTLDFDSHGLWFQGLWHAATTTAVLSKDTTASAASAWTSRITGLTSGKNHHMCVFQNRVSLCVANGNVVKQYNSSYANTTDLTIPSDYEIVGLAYNNNRLAVITRLSNDGTNGQDQEAKMFIWDGATTAANAGFSVGSDAAVFVIPYRASFVVLNRAGELLYYNGGGFERLAAFPFYFSQDIYGGVFDTNALGYAPMAVDGDTILINIGVDLQPFGQKDEDRRENTMSGVWCYDPKAGLYHKYSPSMSQGYVNYVSTATAATNTLTATAGVYGLQTIPATGNLVRLTDGTVGGVTKNKVYYVIKVSSTEFKLATTKENAEAGVAVDITSDGAITTYFWFYDIVDYGNTYYEAPGAMSVLREKTQVYTDTLFGARLVALADQSSVFTLSIAVPELENRGYFVTPKLFSTEVTDTAQKLFLKYRPLKDTDSIVVKYRTRDVLGLPVASSGLAATWTSTDAFYTTQDLSEAKTHLDAGNELECELISGAGAGQCVKVTAIDYAGGTYAVTLAESPVGAAAALKSEFIMANWTTAGTLTSGNQHYGSVPVASTGKFMQFKVELRGSDIAIEELQIVNSPHEQSR